MIENYININSYFDYKIMNQNTRQQCTIEELNENLPKSLVALETSKDKNIAIPKEVQKSLAQFRPTPLFRAKKLEQAIGTTCEIYIKNEGYNPSNTHKANSAYLIAHLCAKDHIKRIVTETTGNWGIALAIACKKFNIDFISMIDETSNRIRPDRKTIMERHGANVKVIQHYNSPGDLLVLSADNAIEYAKNLEDTVYIFGSVYGYFVIPQTIIGIEAALQLEAIGRYPDIIVGSCGGGANLLGTAAQFISNHIELGKNIEIFASESVHCPILSNGVASTYSIDSQNYYPLIETYGIDGLLNPDIYIGGLGSTIVAPAVAHFHQKGLIKSDTFTQQQAQTATQLFFNSEKIKVALETGYQLAGLIQKAKENDHKVLLANISCAN